jgi:D-alanyl-D-alanine carboxypeptidase/D-alanyl-D-alanine-endopeptidase (penicillin-binding protein 4)
MDLLPGLRRAGLSALFLVAACAGDPGPAPSPPPAPVPIVALAPEAGHVAVEAGVLAPQAGLVAAEVQAVVPAAPSLAEGDVLAEGDGREAAAASSPLSPPVLLADTAALRAAVASRPAGAAIGFVVLDLETGQELAALSPDRPLIPASTTKLATAVVALDVLGPEHRFRTELLATGPVRDGVLQGDLILRGDGDPTLDVADLLELAVRLATRGVRRVEGRLLIDDSALPRLPEIEPTQPLEAGYNPSVGALSLAFNRVLLSWRGGGRIDAATLPPLDEARFEPARPELLPPSGIELESAGDEDVVWSLADRGARRQEAALPVKDPGLHAGRIFRRLALAQGLLLDRPERAGAPGDAKVLAAHESPPLRQLVRDMLLYSNNLMAELIGLSAARRLGNDSPDLAAAGMLLTRHLAALMPEVDWQGAALGNHSGLDGEGRLTPRQLAALVRYGWRAAALPALLPGSGWTGTLANRFAEPDEALRVWAKTGAVNYGSALAGYLFPPSDRPAVFATMISDLPARAAYDALPRPERAAEAAAGAWNARARATQDRLVRSLLEPVPTS